jgi:hypothetical protein
MTTEQAAPDDAVPDEVVDRLLWRDAQYVLARHRQADDRADGDRAGAGCACCGASWPCTARRLAERAEAASRMPWRDGWTTRHDLNAMLALPEWRAAALPARRTQRAALPARRPRPYVR